MAPALCTLLLLPLSGCSLGGSGHAAPKGTVIHVNEKDFKITAPTEVAAGKVRLIVHNAGPETHELLLVRLPANELPLRLDGTTVDEETLEPEMVTTVEGAPPGDTNEVDLTLEPGTYSLFCNMSGHFLGGMHTTLVVT